MSGRKEAEFVVREHWRSRNGEEREEQLDKILALWRAMSRAAAGWEEE